MVTIVSVIKLDLVLRRSLSCGRAPSRFVATLLQGLGCLADSAGVSRLRTKSESSGKKESSLYFFSALINYLVCASSLGGVTRLMKNVNANAPTATIVDMKNAKL